MATVEEAVTPTDVAAEKRPAEPKSPKSKGTLITQSAAKALANRAGVKIVPAGLIVQIQELCTDLITRIGDKATDIAESAEKKTIKVKHVIPAIRDVTGKTVVPAVPVHKESGLGCLSFQTPIRKLVKKIIAEKCDGVRLVGEEAVILLNALTNAVAKAIVERAADNAMTQDRQTIKPDDLYIALSVVTESKIRAEELKQSALRILFPDGKTKQVESVRELDLAFPKGRVERLARTWYDGRWAEDAHIYFAALLQAIIEDVIFYAGQVSASRKKQTLKGQHVYAGLEKGEYAEMTHRLDLLVVHGAPVPVEGRTPGKRNARAAKVMQPESAKILIPLQTFRRILKIVATGAYRVAGDAAVTMQLFIENYLVKLLQTTITVKRGMGVDTIRVQPNEFMAIVDMVESW